MGPGKLFFSRELPGDIFILSPGFQSQVMVLLLFVPPTEMGSSRLFYVRVIQVN